MRPRFAAAAVLFIAVSAGPASATALQPGDVVFYNYNFLGGPFAPPYDHLVVTFNFANVGPGAVLSLAFYDDPNGTGLFFFADSEPVPPALLTFNAFGFGAAVDGVFSVRVQAAVSPWELLSTTATAFGSPSGPPLFTVTGTIASTATAPEPATVVLLVSALAAGVARRVTKTVIPTVRAHAGTRQASRKIDK